MIIFIALLAGLAAGIVGTKSHDKKIIRHLEAEKTAIVKECGEAWLEKPVTRQQLWMLDKKK